MAAGDTRGHNLGNNAADFRWQRAAIGIAKHDPARAGIIGGAQARQGIGGVGAVAVKEMFGVKQGFAALGAQMDKGLADRDQVFVQRDAKRGDNMKLMRLADQTNRRRVRVQDGGKDIVILGRAAKAFGHPKGGHRGADGRRSVEKLAIGRVGAGPTALDIVHPERIQRRRDLALFGGGELDPLGLLTIAQGGVEKV